MEEIKETAPAKPVVPDSEDKITREEADRAIVLLKLDIANVRLEKAKALKYASACDASIAELESSVADLERRVVGVKYPEAKAQEPAAGTGGQPVMKEPVGPGTGK